MVQDRLFLINPPFLLIFFTKKDIDLFSMHQLIVWTVKSVGAGSSLVTPKRNLKDLNGCLNLFYFVYIGLPNLFPTFEVNLSTWIQMISATQPLGC